MKNKTLFESLINIQPDYVQPPCIHLEDGTHYPDARQWTARDLMKWRQCQKCYWYAERADHVGECGKHNDRQTDRVFKTCNNFCLDDEEGLRALMLTKRQLQTGDLNLTEEAGTAFHPCQMCGASWMLADVHYCAEAWIITGSNVPLDHPCHQAGADARGRTPSLKPDAYENRVNPRFTGPSEGFYYRGRRGAIKACTKF